MFKYAILVVPPRDAGEAPLPKVALTFGRVTELSKSTCGAGYCVLSASRRGCCFAAPPSTAQTKAPQPPLDTFGAACGLGSLPTPFGRRAGPLRLVPEGPSRPALGREGRVPKAASAHSSLYMYKGNPPRKLVHRNSGGAPQFPQVANAE